jgi:hypothetical protein
LNSKLKKEFKNPQEYGYIHKAVAFAQKNCKVRGKKLMKREKGSSLIS